MHRDPELVEKEMDELHEPIYFVGKKRPVIA